MWSHHQVCHSRGLRWGFWEFPVAWFHKGSQFFIGHLWPLLQVGRELLGALSWLEQNGSASLGSCG